VLFGLSLRPEADRTPQALTPTVLHQPGTSRASPNPTVPPRGGTAASAPPAPAGDAEAGEPEAGDVEGDRQPNRNAVPGPPARPLDKAVDDFVDLVAEGFIVDAISGDAAQDLKQTADNVGATLRNGGTSVRDGVREMRRKIRDRTREGSISEEYGDLLEEALDRIKEAA
jgi:hypothetical protein